MVKFRVGPSPVVIIRRQRLLDRLTEGVRRSVTLVTAPTGAGKTTLVGSWVTDGLPPGVLTWISLDDGDERPGVFWSYVLEGLSRSGVAVPAVAAPPRAEVVDQSFLIRLSAALYGRREPVVLVLDDADVLVDSLVLHQLDFVLRHAGSQLRVVLVGRAHPGPTLLRHRLAGSLTEIGLDDLAFTPAEARTLLQARGVTPSDAALTKLMTRTRGWATGLVLAATSAGEGPEAGSAVTLLDTDRDQLAAYFRTEVLAAQPPGVRRFLLRTSIVTHLRPALADQLTGRRDAERLLPTLARTNSFLAACSQHDGCYRYHPMFAELLRENLDQETPATVASLHHKAAAWWRAAGSPADAVPHAAAAGDWSSAAALLVDDLAMVRLLLGSEVAGLASLLSRMPPEAGGPDTAVVAAAAAIGRSDVGSCRRDLARARRRADDEQVEPTRSRTLTIALIELALARTDADLAGALAAAAAAESSLDDLESDGIAVPAGARTLVHFGLASALFSAGFHDRAAATLTKGLRAAPSTGCEPLRATCLGSLALVNATRGRLSQAAELGRAANTLADQCGLDLRQRPAAADVALAWVFSEECDAWSARFHAHRAAAAVVRSADPVTAGLDAYVRSGLLRTTGDLDGALSILRQARRHRSSAPLPGWLDSRLHAAAVAVEVVAGRPDAAISSIQGSSGPAGAEITLELARADLARGDVSKAGATTTGLLRRTDLSVPLRVDGWLLQASCALERGEEKQARAALDRALRLAEPERMRRPVAEASPRLRRFIRHDGEITTRHPWLGGPQAGIAPKHRTAVPAPRATAESTAAPVIIVEPLTEKEREVLGYLAALLSTEEIATTMFVSVNTVKTHVRGILRKLAASRRNEAIRRARELRLI